MEVNKLPPEAVALTSITISNAVLLSSTVAVAASDADNNMS